VKTTEIIYSVSNWTDII